MIKIKIMDTSKIMVTSKIMFKIESKIIFQY